jgi:squalene cyclase
MAAPSLLSAGRALERAVRVVRTTQRADGSWDGNCDMGPLSTAQAVVVLQRMGQLLPADAQAAARWLRSQQRPDGSFVMFPAAPRGHIGATAAVWAALHLAAPKESEAAIAKARAFIDGNGGVGAVISNIEAGDFSALLLSMAGLLDARRLPAPTIALLGLSPLVSLVRTRFNSGVLFGAFQLTVLVRWLRSEPLPLSDRLGLNAGIELLTTFQNPDGSWNDSVQLSALALPTLVAAGVRRDDLRIVRGLRWLESQAMRGPHGLHFNGFGSEVWATAFHLRGLFDAGVAPADPVIARALGFLADAQSFAPMPAFDNRQRGAVLTGGFGFQRSNSMMVDTDDTGVVLSALGAAMRWSGPGALSGPLEARLERTVRRAHDWLLSMQNPDGGWSAFIWGLPSKSPGAAMKQTVRAKLNDPLAMAALFLNPPPSLGDPSTEDVTARVLLGLGATGFSIHSRPVARAVAFLQRQQCQSGAFWGRWVVNYLSCTAFVLMGLKAVGADRDAEWIRKAIRWVLSKQNDDGGWGETPASYSDETLAGEGPSMPPLTALVLKGLLDIGERSEATDRAAAYLVRAQHKDGSFPNRDYLHTNVAPDTFYLYEEATRFYPTAAIATWINKGGAAPKVVPRFTAEQLQSMRQVADPDADEVVRSIYAGGEVDAVRKMLGRLFASDEPVPTGLPAEVQAYFEKWRQLPDGIDTGKLQLAGRLFTRAGWMVAASLFCSSLPQAYCAANGAHVLIQSQRMTKHLRKRIFETAQFVFDVCDEGAMEPQGRGIYAALKVRLMHAAIRHLILTGPAPWDKATLGLPINQEDMAGTLMTFSVVILDALPRLGIEVSDAEADAWLHLWQLVGHLLGVQRDVVPNTVDEGEQLMDLIRAGQWRRSDDGVQLARVLIELMQEGLHNVLPTHLLDGLPLALVRRLAGDHASDLLGLPTADWTTHLINAGVAIGTTFDLEDELSRARLFAKVSHEIMAGVVLFEREGKQAQFRIPKSLQKP